METRLDEHLAASPTAYVDASKGKRFANYIIDYIAIYGAIFVIGMVMGISEATGSSSFGGGESVNWGYNIIGIILYVAYYGLCEAAFQGRTLGKLITGTQAMRLDGNKLTGGQILGRSLASYPLSHSHFLVACPRAGMTPGPIRRSST